MTEQEKINGWTFEETVKTAENLMEAEQNIFKWDVLRHIRDFAENYKHELEQYTAIGTPEECRAAVEKQKAIKPLGGKDIDGEEYDICRECSAIVSDGDWHAEYCPDCGQKVDWKND